MLLLLILICVYAGETFQGELICNLCVDACNQLKELAETKGIDAVKNYLNSLCEKVSGFILHLCDAVVNFGIDELLKLIENRVDSNEICKSIGVCEA